jgi:hypothetical protein
MKERSPDNGPFRVIEGGKKELREHNRLRAEPSSGGTNVQRVRQLSPSLDEYLRQPPADRAERMSLLEKISRELWDLPAGGADPRDVALQRTKAKVGEFPRTENYNWKEATDQQIEWDERFALEYASAVGENMAAIEEQRQKLSDLEDHLTEEATKAYGDDGDFKPRTED